MQCSPLIPAQTTTTLHKLTPISSTARDTSNWRACSRSMRPAHVRYQNQTQTQNQNHVHYNRSAHVNVNTPNKNNNIVMSSAQSLFVPQPNAFPAPLQPLVNKNKKQTVPSRCLCFFDVEASGPSLRDHFVPCLGLAIVCLGQGKNEPRILFRKKWYITPPTPHRSWDERTLREFWLQPAIAPFYNNICHILSHNVPLQNGFSLVVDPYRAMSEFVAVCRLATCEGQCEVTLMSDTSGFDFSWLYYYLSHFGPPDCSSPSYLFGMYKPVRDITSYFAGFGGDLNARYAHRSAMQKLGLYERDWKYFARRAHCPPYDHDPEHDAAHVGLRSAWIMWCMEQYNTTFNMTGTTPNITNTNTNTKNHTNVQKEKEKEKNLLEKEKRKRIKCKIKINTYDRFNCEIRLEVKV